METAQRPHTTVSRSANEIRSADPALDQ